MQKPQKIGLLLLLLAIPIFFILFFELFSTSHYAVPVFYESGIDSLKQCESSTRVHRVGTLQAQNILTKNQQVVDFSGKLRVVYPLPTECGNKCELLLQELARLQNIFESDTPLQFLFTTNSPSSHQEFLADTYNQARLEWLLLQGTEEEYGSFLQCELVLPRPSIPLNQTLVLVDEKGQIRGYYQGTSAEEVDRLIAEVKILLYTMNYNERSASNAG